MHHGAAQAETSVAWWFGSVKIIYIPSGASGTVRACLALLVLGQARRRRCKWWRMPLHSKHGFWRRKARCARRKKVVLNALQQECC